MLNAQSPKLATPVFGAWDAPVASSSHSNANDLIVKHSYYFLLCFYFIFTPLFSLAYPHGVDLWQRSTTNKVYDFPQSSATDTLNDQYLMGVFVMFPSPVVSSRQYPVSSSSQAI